MTLRVLIVEDSPTDAKLIVHALRRLDPDVSFERVEEAAPLRAALTRAWDVILSDWAMPRFTGLAALELVREVAPEIPFILVSGTVGEEVAVEAMRGGAADYVLKDRLGRLVPAVERALRERAESMARRRAEEALAEIEGRFARLSEAGIIGVVVADVHGDILEANDAYLKMIGYTREDLQVGIRWQALTAPEAQHRSERAGEQLMATGSAAPWETVSIRRDGSRAPMLVGVSMLEHPRCIAFAIDLTERERMQAALRETEDQLRHAQKMEAVGRLAGGIAHDFNNLLSVILCYGEILREGLNPADPMREDLGEIVRAGERAEHLTRQLLLFSRQQVLQPELLDLSAILTGMEHMLRRIVGEDVDLEVLATPTRGFVNADRGSIEQVVMNLVVNARDAMPTGGKLTLESADITLDEAYRSTHHDVTPGRYVMLAVTDSGMGMDRATQARIFDPFFTTKEVGRGTGLGLSTVFGIVKQSGGSVWVYSEPGQGATFKVYLPRVDGAVEHVAVLPTPETLMGTETILLVEDEDQLRIVARGVLRRHGYRVLEARNGGEALLLCERHKGTIDLLLTDVVMPHMSGPELAVRLALLRPEMKLLCMSGYTDDSVVRHGVLGANIAYLQKPITPSSLTRRVRQVLDV